MKNTRDLLFEIGTEELPSKLVKTLNHELPLYFAATLHKQHLEYGEIKAFTTPRRLALYVSQLAEVQKAYVHEKKGPALKLAFDATNQPTPAALGFAKSCGVTLAEITQNNSSPDFLMYRQSVQGAKTSSLLSKICHDTLNALPLPKVVRWGALNIEFIRPVHWVTLLFGDELISIEILGKKTDRYTHGHRFHHPQAIYLNSAQEYEEKLIAAFVIPNFDKRRDEIKQQIDKLTQSIPDQSCFLDPDLLDENCSITEWPVAMMANFDKKFLKIPQEALISAMKTHQKSFFLLDTHKKLLPRFIFISNIKSLNPPQVIMGNEKVMRARLDDAAFFYHSDCKHNLDTFLDRLKGVIFQTKLGDLYQRANRLSNLAEFIADEIKIDKREIAAKAGLLAKADLMSDMVNEFPELQGVMGYYYALHEDLSQEIALAIKEHYQPRFASDQLPKSSLGNTVALADKIDKLIGLFGIHQLPTGTKDPFGLRRDALGIIRICIFNQYHLSLLALFNKASALYKKDVLPNQNLFIQLQDFFLERLRAWYLEQQIAADVFSAVAAKGLDSIYDFHLRILAVTEFRKLKEAYHLTLANKRVNNILLKENINSHLYSIDENLLTHDAEKNLANCLKLKQNQLKSLFDTNNYQKILLELASLQKPVDRFFDEVMVMVEDKKLRYNRLAILQALRNLFLQVADISQLQAST